MEKGLTVKEIKQYQKEHPQKVEVYGKYGMLAKAYLEENDPARYWTLGEELPKYLHQIDEKAEEMFEELYLEFSKKEEYQKTGDFQKDLIREQEKKNRIENIIIKNLIYTEEE